MDTNLQPHNPATPTGSRPCNKPHSPSCQLIHQLMYQPHLPHNYPCRMQVYEPYLPAPMQCMQCFLHWRNPQLSLSDHMNGHCFTTTVSNPALPVAIHTQSHQIPFQDCWSVSNIHKLPDSTPGHIHRQFEIAYQLVLQSHHTPGLNIR